MRGRPWSSLQERLESTEVGRAVISAFILVTLVVIVAANLPRSKLQSELVQVSDPYISGIGINQVWGVFAPDPLRTVVAVEARIRYSDGSTSIWRPPHGWPFPDSYSDVHWIRWLDAAGQEAFFLPTARWLTREAARNGRKPVEITLVKRTYGLLPPGRTPNRTPWHERVLFSYDPRTDKLVEPRA